MYTSLVPLDSMPMGNGLAGIRPELDLLKEGPDGGLSAWV